MQADKALSQSRIIHVCMWFLCQSYIHHCGCNSCMYVVSLSVLFTSLWLTACLAPPRQTSPTQLQTLKQPQHRLTIAQQSVVLILAYMLLLLFHNTIDNGLLFHSDMLLSLTKSESVAEKRPGILNIKKYRYKSESHL